MMIVRALVVITLVIVYGLVFTVQDQKARERDITLELALPVSFQKIAAGYVKQLAAEMLFIRTSVFLGGVRPGTPPASYEVALGNNFAVMTQLYPRFIDPYHFCQAFLPPISPESAAKAATIFETGIEAFPDDIVLRFFYGTNFFLNMNEPLQGAQAFSEATKLPQAPPMFAHLAALLSAQGGNIAAGLISLKAMLAGEKDEVVRKRYEEELVIFEQTLAIQTAVTTYTTKNGSAPETLQQLVPEYVAQLPDTKDYFDLVYTPPSLHLKRPDLKQKKTGSGVPLK